MIILVGGKEELRLVPLHESRDVVGVIRLLHMAHGRLFIRESQRAGRADVLVEFAAVEIDELDLLVEGELERGADFGQIEAVFVAHVAIDVFFAARGERAEETDGVGAFARPVRPFRLGRRARADLDVLLALNVIPGFPQFQVVDEVEFVVFPVGAADAPVHLLAHVILQRRLVPGRENEEG